MKERFQIHAGLAMCINWSAPFVTCREKMKQMGDAILVRAIIQAFGHFDILIVYIDNSGIFLP